MEGQGKGNEAREELELRELGGCAQRRRSRL